MTHVGPLEAQLQEQQEAFARSGINAAEDPEAFNRASEELLAGASPFDAAIQMPPNMSVTLPSGLVDPLSLAVTNTVTIRELNGYDEEALAKTAGGTAALEEVVVRAVTRPQLDQGAVSNMLVGDRDAIVLAVRNATFGPVWELGEGECKTCGEVVQIAIDLGEVEIRSSNKRLVEHTLRSGSTIVVRFPTHGDMVALANNRKATTAEQNTLLLSRCLVSFGDVAAEDMDTDSLTFVRQLSAAARRALIRKIVAEQPGPILEAVPLRCPNCGDEQEVPVNLTDTF